MTPDDAGRRPALHFTPHAGWINDPHGIVHADGVYHLFFQCNPAGTTWAAAVSWGHATSADLLTWHEQPPALTRSWAKWAAGPARWCCPTTACRRCSTPAWCRRPGAGVHRPGGR